jgi:hypothetical protein
MVLAARAAPRTWLNPHHTPHSIPPPRPTPPSRTFSFFREKGVSTAKPCRVNSAEASGVHAPVNNDSGSGEGSVRCVHRYRGLNNVTNGPG